MYRIAEKVGSVFQNPRTQFFNVDTDSEIAFGMENEAVPQERMERCVVETAKALRIENLLGRNIFALSGGEKQKIAFASVYAMEPEIYLLDEPSSNLDMTALGALREHLRLIKSQGKTVIIAEHRLHYLTDVADRIIYLENGSIAGDWTPEQFRLLSAEKRQSMGLRALDLHEDKPMCAAAPKQLPVLELQNVSLAYKKQPVLCDISLQAAPGDVIAVVGHNGAGKTTFSRALCGLHKETSGSYLWNGNSQKPKERMKRSYMVMQDVNYQLFAESVEAECTFGIKHPDTELAKKHLRSWGLFRCMNGIRIPFRVGRSSGWRRRHPWSAGRSCWYLMSRPVDWIMTVWCGFRLLSGVFPVWARSFLLSPTTTNLSAAPAHGCCI